MISKRLQYIMPPMSLEEILEKAKLQALDFKEVDFLQLELFEVLIIQVPQNLQFLEVEVQMQNGRNCFE